MFTLNHFVEWLKPYLGGLKFPAKKKEIVEACMKNGLELKDVNKMNAALKDDKEYKDAKDVAKAVTEHYMKVR